VGGFLRMDEFYGLQAQFEFVVDPQTKTSMGWVRSQLGGIETDVESLSRTLGRNNIASQFTTEASQVQRATRRTTKAVDQMSDTLKVAAKSIDPLKREFRALRAESRNIEFGELTDPEQFQRASREIKQYVSALKALETQITGNTTAEREFGATLKRQQSIAETRIDLAHAERRAAIASQNLGSAQALQGGGQSILRNLTEPIEAAKELQQGLGTIKKLAGDISDRGLVEIKNNILNLSAAMGVADTQISSVFEDLAGAGKDFSDAIDPKTGKRAIENRIAEVNQILKNKSALDITTGAATQLNITLGSIYKKSLPQYAGGVVEVNARAASAINDLTDRLEDVRISAEDVIPVMNVVMNTIGDAANFPVDQIAAFSAAVSALGTIEPEAAGSFFNRFSAAVSKGPGAYVDNLGYGTLDAFNEAINTDKLGVVIRIAETYKSINGELERGKFLGKGGLGLGSAQDQKLIQGLANNIEVLNKARGVARQGFYGEAGEDLSVQAEFSRVMQTSSFQAERFTRATEALKHTLGLAIQEALTPVMEILSNIVQMVLTLTQKFPGITKAIALTAVALGGLATAAGTAGVVLFGLEQAGAVASVAMISMQRSMLPLTGFFATAQTALAATNPLETFFRSNTKLAADFGRAATGNFEETTTGLQILGRQAINTGRAVFAFSRSLLLSPFGVAIGSFILLNTLVEQVVPGLNLFGVVLGAIAAPFGFIWGVIKGITESFLSFLGLTGSGAMSAIAPMFQTISNAISMAAQSFTLFASSGERVGRALGNAILFPFEFAARKIVSVWNATLGAIRNLLRPFADFVQRVGQMLIGFLAEASPGPTYWIRRKWVATVQFLQGLFQPLLNVATFVGSALNSALSPVTRLFAKRTLDIGVQENKLQEDEVGDLLESLIAKKLGAQSIADPAVSKQIIGTLRQVDFSDSNKEIVAQITKAAQDISLGKVKSAGVDSFISPFTLRFADIKSNWGMTSESITQGIRSLVGVAQVEGHSLQSALSEASPGPTYWIRQKWSMTVQFLQGLFVRLGQMAGTVKNSLVSMAPAIAQALPTVVQLGALAARFAGLINPMALLAISTSVFLFKGILKAVNGSVEEAIPTIANTLTIGLAAIAGRAWAYGIITPIQGMAAIGGGIIGNLLAKGIIQHFDQIKSTLQNVIYAVREAAVYIKGQISSLFTAVLPQLPNAVSIATVLAELSGIINPIQGLAIAIGNTIFGGIVESMGKSLDEVIPIFIRRFSLIAAFGGFLAQRLNFIQPLQARIIAGIAVMTGLSTLYFKSFSIDVTNIWHSTIQAIQGDLQALAGIAKNIGLLLISFLAEASPGPTYWIREKWGMTIEFLQGLFRRIAAAASVVNQAFLSIGDVTADQRMVARQAIFEGIILTLVSGIKSLFYVGRALTWVYDNLQRVVNNAIANFDLLGFSLLTVASLPATMVPLLREGFEQVIPELALLAEHGIPRAIVFGLPGAIAIAMSSGLVKGFEQGFANYVAGMPARSAAFSHAVYGMFNQGLKSAVNQGLSEGVTAFVRALPDELGGRSDFTFNFDFDAAYAAYEEQRNARTLALVSYLQQVGTVANEVGAQLQAAFAPILSFQFGGVPVIPFFSVIIPFRNALLELATSPAIQGFILFLSGTVLPTVARTLAAIATTIGFIFNTFVTLPVAAAINVLTREAVAATRAVIQAGLTFVTAIPALVGQAVVMLAAKVVEMIATTLARIPYIGQAVSQAFLSSISFLVATSQVYFQLLTRSFQRFTTQIWTLLGPTYQRLATEIFQGIVYGFQQGVRPAAAIVGRLVAGIFDPRTIGRFLSLYIRTGGFRQIFKPGLFAINPIDIFFGGIPGISKSMRWLALALFRIQFPVDVISKKTEEVVQIFALQSDRIQAELMSKRLDRTILVPLETIIKSQPAIGRFFLEVYRGILLINPLSQILGRIALTTLFWYSVLKPITPEMFRAIEATEFLGVSLAPVANILRGMRFVFVDLGEGFLKFVKSIPPFIRATQRLFNLLGTITGVIVHEAVGITSILLNIFKATFGNLLIVASIGFAGLLDLALINLRNWASFLRLKTQQYGDAIVAALHGHFGPLVHQIFSDIAQGVTIVFQRTVGAAARAIASVAVNTFRLLSAIGEETIRFIRDPYNESIRLAGLFQAWVNDTFGGIAQTINTYIRQLQLDRLARFLGNYWIQLAAIADVLLLVTGVLNPLQFVISALIGLGLFLVNEYRTGFQTLDALIAGLANPIEFVTNAINTMIGALGVYIPPELTEFIGGVTEQFVKSLPIIAGGVFLLALLIRRNIGQAFQDVVGGVMKIVGGVMQAVDATRIFGGVIRDTASSAQVQTQVGAQVHQVRRKESVLGIRNPFAYSQNEDQQRRATMLGDERVSKSRAALRYQDEINKSLEKITKEEEAEVKRLARSRNARDQIMAFGGKLQRPDGFSYDVAPLLEKKKGLFGLERLELSETGRARVAEEARRKITSQDSDIAKQTRMRAAMDSGLATSFVKHGGTIPPDEVLRTLAQQGDYGVTNLLGAFQKAMENLHVQDFQVDKLYVAEFSRPRNFPTQTPYSPAAFDNQLNKFQSDPKYQKEEVIKKGVSSRGLENLFSKELAAAHTQMKSAAYFATDLTASLTNAFSDLPIASDKEMSEYAKRLAGKMNKNEEFVKEQNIIINELIQKQFKQIVKAVPDFSKMEESNLAALKEVQRNVEGFHPVATNTDVLTQAVRNVAGQTQSEVDQLNKTRRSFFSSLFGFTGIPQLIENFQYNRRLFRRSQRIARRVEEMATEENKERGATASARQRGLEALMSNAGYRFPDQSVQFYAAKQINAQEQAFIESWIKNRNFKVDVTQHEAFRPQVDKILANFKQLSTNLTLNTIDDVKKFRQTLDEVSTQLTKEEQASFKKLEQYLLHGASDKPKGSQVSFSERDDILGAINKSIANNLKAFGITGQHKDISKANFKDLRDKYDDTVNRLTSRFVGTGEFIAQIGGKNEYIEGAYKELEKKLGLGTATGASLRQIQNIKLKNSIRQIGVNFGIFVEDTEDRVTEFRDGIYKKLDKFQDRLEATLPFPSLAPRITDLLRRPFEMISNNIETIYAAQKANIQNTVKQLRSDFVGSNLISRIDRLNKQYREAREASLQTILQSSKDERIANLARRGAATGQLGRVWEKLNKQQFTDAQSGQTVTTLMRGAMSKEAVSAMLGQELRRQGLSREQVSTEIDKVLSQFGNQTRYSVGDILKMRGLDVTKVSKALESTLSLQASEVEKIIKNPNYTARAIAPFQWFLVRDMPGIIKDAAKGFVGTINKIGGGAIAKLAGIVAKDIAVGFKGEFLNTLAKSIRTLSNRLGIGANNLALGMERIVGKNPFSDAVRGFSDFLRARGKATADFLKAQALVPDDTRSLTKLIKNRTIELFKVIGSTIQSAQAAIQAQGGGVFGAIRALFSGLKGFFGKLFNRSSNSQIAQLDNQIQQQRDRAARARERQGRAQSLTDNRVDLWVREAGQKTAQRQYDIARQADAQAARLQRQRSLTEKFSNPRYSPAGGDAARIAGSLMGRIGKTYEETATKLGQRITELRDQRTGVRSQRQGETLAGEQMYTPKSSGGWLPRNLRLDDGVVSSTEYIQSLTTKAFTKLTESAHSTTLKLSNYFKNSALRSETAWEESANHITGKSWWAMTKRAVWTGVKIVTNLNHGAADVTAAAWERSQQSVSQDMHQMAQTAQQTGQQISQSMGQAAQKSTGFLSHIGNSIGRVGKAGMAIGASVTAVGFGAQTAMYSLSTMGLISEETSQQLNKFFEIFTLIGAVGGIATPIITALATSFGAIGSLALAATTGVAAIGGAIAPLIGLGSVAFAPFLVGIAAVAAAMAGLYFAVRTNFLGIGTVVRGIGSLISNALSVPIGFIESAWQGFVDRFGSKLMPIIQPALDIAQGLINALNHNPTEKIPAAWDIAGERIKGVLDSILGAGQAVGNGLVSFFTPIVSLFNPLTSLFKKKDKQQPISTLPEVETTQESPEKGVLGSIMAAIKSLVMLPVNLIKGLADWVASVITGVIKGVITAITGPLQWAAEALRPLQMPIGQIELFFKNLVSIIQSVIYLNGVMRPLAANAISVNATINAIAQFFYSLRSLIQSVEFLYYHVFNRKALVQGMGQGEDAVDPSKGPTNRRTGNKLSGGYVETGGKAIQDLSLGEAAKESVGLFKNIMSIKENTGAVFGGFKTGLNWVGSAWQNTSRMIRGETGTLVADAEVQGYNLQKNLSEGSPGPTFWIRQNWEKTTKALQGWMGDLSGKSKEAGQDIAANLTPDPVTPTPTISPVVDSPRQATGFTALRANAIAAVNAITDEVRASYQVLQSSGIGNIGALIIPGLSQTGRSVRILSGDFWDFGKRAVVALATLNFGELSGAVKDLGGNFGYFTQGVLLGFKQMIGGAIAFGMYTVASISPFLLILGGVAFVAAVILANFLGLRTILGGAFRIGIGLGQILISVISGIVNIGRSLGMVIGGVFLAMRGDFRLLDQGIAQFKASFQEMGRGVLRGLRTIRSSISQILRGIETGITQIFPMFPAWVNQLKGVARAFRNPERAGEIAAEILIGAFNRIKKAIGVIPMLLGRIPGLFRRNLDTATTTVNQFGANIWDTVNRTYRFFRTLTFKGIVKRFTTEFRDLPQFLGRIPGQLATKIEEAIPALKAPFNYLRGFIRGFVRRLAQELPPNIVKAVSTSLQAGTAKVRLTLATLSGQLISAFRELATRLGLEERFNRMIQKVSDRWKGFTAWVKQGNLFNWVPRTTQEVSDLFVATINKIESAWNRFTKWLGVTTLFPSLFNQLERVSRGFSGLMKSLDRKWSELKIKFGVPVFTGFFESLRGLGTKFIDIISDIAGHWEKFAKPLKLPLLQNFFTEVALLGEKFNHVVSFIERKWKGLATFIYTTPLISGVMQGLEYLGSKFNELILFVQLKWKPFVKAISSAQFFPNAFKELRKLGAAIPGLKTTIQNALQDIPQTATRVFNRLTELATAAINKVKKLFSNIFGRQNVGAIEGQPNLKSPLVGAVDHIQERWERFAKSFKSILEPITGFARRVADKLIKALNCSPTVVIPNAWENAVNNITSTLQLLIEPFRRVGKFIVNTFGFAFEFVESLFSSFYKAISPGIEKILASIKRIKQGAVAADEIGSLFQGISGYLERLKNAIKPVTQLFDRFSKKMNASTAEGQQALSMGEGLGRAFGQLTIFLTKFTLQAIPPLLKVLAIIVRITVEIAVFAAKVAYALRFVINYFTRVGFSVADTIASITRFVRSTSKATDQVRGAFNKLKDDVRKFVTQFSEGMTDLGRALRRLVGAILDVFAPQLKPALKSVIADFESFASLMRFAVVDLVSTVVERMQQMYKAVTANSPFELMEKGFRKVRQAAKSFGKALQQLAVSTGLAQALEPVAAALAPIARWLGITSKNAKTVGQAFRESGTAISSTLADVRVQVQGFFGGLATQARESAEQLVIYYRAALDDLAQRIRSSFPFQILEGGFKRVQEIGSAALATIQAKAEQVGAAFRHVLVALKLDVPFDQGVASAQKFGDQSVIIIDWALTTMRKRIEQVTDWIRQQFSALGDAMANAIAQAVAKVNTTFSGIGDGFKASLEQMAGQVDTVMGSVKAYASKVMLPYAPIIDALKDVFAALQKIAGALAGLIGDITVFGLKVDTIVTEVILNFGKATFAIMDLVGKVLTPFGLMGILTALVNIAGAVKDLIVNFGKLVGEAVPVLGALGNAIKDLLLIPLEAIGSVWNNTIGKIQSSMAGLTKKSKSEGEQIAEAVGEAPAQKSRQFWKRNAKGVQADVEVLTEELKVEGKEIESAIGEVPARKSWLHWKRTTQAIQSEVEALTEDLKIEGHEIQAAISEGSPGTTKWIRHHWKRTGDFIRSQIEDVASVAKGQGKAIQDELSIPADKAKKRSINTRELYSKQNIEIVTQYGSKEQQQGFKNQIQQMRAYERQIQKIRVLNQQGLLPGDVAQQKVDKLVGRYREAGAEARALLEQLQSGSNVGVQQNQQAEEMSERNQKLAYTAQSLFTSLGSALSNFAPQLAMPIFMVNDFITAFFDIKKAIPEVKALIQGTESVAVASNTAIAVSEAAVAQAAGSSAIVLATGAAEAGAAKATEATVVGGANSWMAATYGFLATAAKSAYRSMIVPLIPFLPMILAVSAGIFLLYKAFRTNFSGIGDVVEGVSNFIEDFFGLLFSGAWRTISSIFLNIERQMRAIGRTLRMVGNIVMEPFRPLFAAFGISGQRSVLGNAMVATVNLILLPLKLVAGAINLIISLLGGFIRGGIVIGGIILNFILLPIRLINATIYGISMGFHSAMMGVNQAVNNLLLMPLSIAIGVAYEVASAIAQVGQTITRFILAPFFAIQNAIMRAISPVVDFVMRSIGMIAGAAAIIFTVLNPGLVIGTFIAFVTGATLAARAIQFILGLPLKAIAFLWKNTVGKILGITQGFVESTKGFGEQLKIFLTDPTAAIRESWKSTIEYIQSKLSELGITARAEGQDVARSLTQALPGTQTPRLLAGTTTPPAPRISPAPQLDAHLQMLGLKQAPQDMAELKRAYRQQSKIAHPDAGGDAEQFHRVQNAYDQLKANMESPTRSSVVDTAPIEQVANKVGTLSERMRGLGSGFGSTLSSMGGAISNFSPQLAAPFFILSDFIDAILSVEGLLPGLKAFFAGKKAAAVADAAVTTAANGAIASSNLLVAGTSASTALTVTTGAATSATAVTTEATAVGGANSFMAATYGMLANAARWAYSQILLPILPLLPAILAIVAVVGLLYLAFKTNFLGIGDVIRGVVGGFLMVFGVVWGVMKGVWDAIAEVFGTLLSSFGEIFSALKELVGAIMAPFAPLFALFGGSGSGGGSLGDAINATVKLILLPVKLVADALSWVIRAITFLVVGAIKLGTAIVTKVLSPITQALSFLAPVVRLIRTVLGGIVGVTAGVVVLIGLIGFIATVLVPLIVAGATALFGMVISGMTFLITAAIPVLIQGLITVATVAIPLLINAFLFIATVAIPAIISGLIAIATTAIPLIMAVLSGFIPFVMAGFAFIITTIIPAVVAGLVFIATVAIPAIISGVIALATAAIPLLITFAPIILAVLAIVAAVWLLKIAFDFVFKKIAEFIPFAVQGFQRIAPIILSPFVKLWELIKNVISGIGSFFGNIVSGVKNFFQNIPLVGRLFGGGQSNEGKNESNIQEFAGGGLVQGPGGQAVPVVAHAGEFVVNPEATRLNIGVLEYLNEGGQLALPTPGVGIMPPMPLILPIPVIVPVEGAGSGTTVIVENLNVNFTINLSADSAREAGNEFLRYIEDPRFKRAVRQALRESVETMK